MRNETSCTIFEYKPLHLADKYFEPSLSIRGSGCSLAFKAETCIILSTPHSLAMRAMVFGPTKNELLVIMKCKLDLAIK